MPAQDNTDIRETLRLSWASLRRYKGTVLLCLAVCLAAAAAYLSLRGGAFTGATRLLIDNRILAIAQQDAVYSTSAMTPQLVQSQVEILRSEGLARRVIERLDLMRAPEFVRATAAAEGATPPQEAPLRHGLDVFKKRLSVEVVGQSHVIEARFTAQDPQRAADVANALAAVYLEDLGSANTAAAQASSGWLRNSMRALGTSARVLSPATAPVQRDGPLAPMVLAFSAFCGLLLGTSIALGRGFMDTRIRTPADVASAAGIPPLAVLPLISERKRARPLLSWALARPKTRFALGIRRIVSNLSGATPRVVGITGLRASDGATFVSANVARSLARSGTRVLLIDASRFSGTLTELAQGDGSSEFDLYVDPWSGLRFASLLLSEQPRAALGDLISRHRSAFDIVIVDLPPAQPVPDAHELAPLVDDILLVISADVAETADLRALLQSPDGLGPRVRGIVLNKVAAERQPAATKFYIDERFKVAVPDLIFAPDAGAADDTSEPTPPLPREPERAQSGRSLHSSLLALAFAVMAAAMTLAGTPVQAADYRLGTGDKVRIKVSEWPDLAGEYTLGPSDTLSLPVIGTLEARGRTPTELAAAIAQTLQQRGDLPAPPAASVEIAQYRPFFVLGDVQKPGDYPYRPGLSVLQAVSVAGGYYRPQDAVFRLERDAIAARNDIGRETRVVARTAARIARLEAEQSDSDSIAAPASFDSDPNSNDQALLRDEGVILQTNKQALAKLLDSFDHYKRLYEQEIEAVTAQIATERRQADAVQRELDGLKGLAERGLAPLTRQLTTERTLAQISGTIQGLQATILRARQNIGQTEQRRIEALNARTARINEGLQQARAEARDAAQRLRTARELYQEARVIAPGLQEASRQSDIAPRFVIARPGPQGETLITAERSTMLEPGDVLTVERRLQPGPQESSAVPDAAPAHAQARAAKSAGTGN